MRKNNTSAQLCPSLPCQRVTPWDLKQDHGPMLVHGPAALKAGAAARALPHPKRDGERPDRGSGNG